MKVLLLAVFFALNTSAEEGALVDSLVAKVGREPVFLSDLQRFTDVSKVLTCAGMLIGQKSLARDRQVLLDQYVMEELLYQEARSRKFSTAGMIPEAVRAIHAKEECKSNWQKLGRDYSRLWRTESRAREGESQLVRELEKRMLIEKFRKTEVISDAELWQREAKAKFPVKIYQE